MFIRRTDSYSSPVQKEFGLFGFLTGTGANAYETRRDLGNGYSEVTKNTLGNKISNFFNGTKKVRNQGAPGAGAASYRDGGVFAKIGNKAKAGYDSMKNSVSNNALKSSNAMTPTGVVPKKMTKNPQATQLELFNRDGSPAFKNKPALKCIQPRKPATIGGQPTTLKAVPGVPSIPSSQGIPRQAVSTSVNSRRLTNGVRNARLGRVYFGNLGSVKRLIRR